MPENAEIETRAGIRIPVDELTFRAIRARGPGGQHVNKSSTAMQLRFNISTSRAFDDTQRAKLLSDPDRRITGDGNIVIKAQGYRSQARNRQDAIERLAAYIDERLASEKPRHATRPRPAKVRKRLDDKTRRGRVKALRGKVDDQA